MSKLPTMKYLDCSTAHITFNDSKLLAKSIRETHVCSDSYEYGFYVTIMADQFADEPPIPEFSEAFKSLYQRCIDEGIGMIKFDQDGDKIEGLQNFDW